MQTRAVIASMLLAAICAPWMQSSATGETQMLPAPGFHHLHLNSLDPAAAIDFYTRQFASTSKSSWGGLPALRSPNNVLLLFSKVAAAPATAPQSAIWHFGWHVTDVRKSCARSGHRFAGKGEGTRCRSNVQPDGRNYRELEALAWTSSKS